MRSFIADTVLEDELRDLYADALVGVLDSPCTDESHDAGWSGLAMYAARKAAGISRADLRDALRARGLRVTLHDVKRWEHAAELVGHMTAPPTRVARAVAAVLGVRVGALLDCGECWRAVAETRDPKFREPVEAPGKIDCAALLGRVTAARRASGLTIRETARRAGTAPEQVSRIERGISDGLDINAFLAVLDVLGLDANGNPESGDGGDDGPAPEDPTGPAGSAAVAEMELAGAAP